MTISSIGTTARDYSTIALWWADSPANLVTATDTWEGECYNDSEFTVTASITISGVTTSATYFAALRAASGEGIADHADKLTNALRYNASNGVGIRKTTNYGIVVPVTLDYFTVDGIQIKAANTSRPLSFTSVTSPNHALEVRNCLLQDGTGSGNAFSSTARYNNLAVNNVVIVESNNSVVGMSFGAFGAEGCACNNTIITLAGTSTAFGINLGSSPNFEAKNNAIFGFSDALDTGVTWATGTDYNSTDNATIEGGSNNQTSLTFASQFEDISSAANLDLRNLTTADLVGAGIRDAANTNDLDILGQARVVTPTGQTVGATEFVAGGGAIQAVAGTLPAMSGSLDLVTPNKVSASGILPAMSGDLTKKASFHRLLEGII